jgi:hypothetical protein
VVALAVSADATSTLVPLKRLPPIGVNPWKAAPLHKKNGFLHVFSRMQSSIDGMLSAAPPQGDKPRHGAQMQRATAAGASGDALDGEDSKQEWGEVQSLRKKQLPPIRAAPGTVSRNSNASALPQTKPAPSQDSVFEKTMGKLDAADSSPSAPPAAGDAVEVPAALAQAGLSAEALLRSRISPARSSAVKRMPAPGAEVPALTAENGASPSPVRMGGSPAVPRGALIRVNTSKAAAVTGSVARNSSSSDTSITPPSSSAAAGVAAAEESPEGAPHSPEKKSLRFSDIGGTPTEGASRKHKESVAAPPLGSLRYTVTSDTATASTSTAAGSSTPMKGTAEAGGRTTFTYAPPAPVAAAAAAALNDASAAAAPHAEEEEEVPIAQVFFLAWPELYLEGVQSLIMILALYIALFFTNFVAAAHSSEWKIITFIPAVVCAVLLVYITKCAVMLASIHAVDCDAILEVLEQTEGAAVLSALIKRKVIALLGEMGPDPQAELVNLFSQIDSDGSGSISRDEFAEYMNSIEIHFDRRRWMQVFRSIDTTFDNKVQWRSLHLPPKQCGPSPMLRL